MELRKAAKAFIAASLLVALLAAAGTIWFISASAGRFKASLNGAADAVTTELDRARENGSAGYVKEWDIVESYSCARDGNELLLNVTLREKLPNAALSGRLFDANGNEKANEIITKRMETKDDIHYTCRIVADRAQRYVLEVYQALEADVYSLTHERQTPMVIDMEAVK